MRDLFPGWVPPDEQTLDRYWNEATFAVDTSVLLDLYRFSEEARSGLLKALRSFEERLWIPHQVGLEFHRNRLGVLLDQREAENNLLRELGQIRQDLDEQLSQLLRGAGRRDLAPLRDAIDGGFDSLKEKLKEAEKEHTKGLGDSIRDDPIYEEVVELCAGRVGQPFDDERQTAVIADAEERFRSETPPGYLDADKDEKTKYGDVILWHQLCERAKKTEKPVVLIADDQKADWVWEVRGKTIGPRPELVAEMNEKARVGFHLYTPTRFLQVWEQREGGREVEPEVLAEIEGSTEKKKQSTRIRSSSPIVGTIPWHLGTGVDVNPDPWQAHHSVGREQVELILEFSPRGRREHPDWIEIAVRSPDAEFRSVPVAVSSISESIVYVARYPADFGGSIPLALGTYEVIWRGYFPDKEGPMQIMQILARDLFAVTGSET